MSDSAFGDETGRAWITDADGDIVARCQPNAELELDDDWHAWTELGPDEDGEFTYVSSDPDGYWLGADEFGYIPDWLCPECGMPKKVDGSYTHEQFSRHGREGYLMLMFECGHEEVHRMRRKHDLDRGV